MASGDIVRIGGGTDWSQYEPFNEEFFLQSTPTASRTIVKLVTGEGYVDRIAVRGSYLQLIISIDGTVVYQGTWTNNDPLRIQGILDESSLVTLTGTNMFSRMPNSSEAGTINTPIGMPYLGTLHETETSATSRTIIISKPLFFTNQLKVEVKAINGKSGFSSYASLVGGVKK